MFLRPLWQSLHFTGFAVTEASFGFCCLSGLWAIEQTLPISGLHRLPSQKIHFPCLTYQSSHRLPLACPTQLCFCSVMLTDVSIPNLEGIFLSMNSDPKRSAIVSLYSGLVKWFNGGRCCLQPGQSEFNSQFRKKAMDSKLPFDLHTCVPTHIHTINDFFKRITSSVLFQLRQEEHELEASLNYIESLIQKAKGKVLFCFFFVVPFIS